MKIRLEKLMSEDEKPYGDWIFYIVVIYVLILSGIALYFPWHKAGNLTSLIQSQFRKVEWAAQVTLLDPGSSPG